MGESRSPHRITPPHPALRWEEGLPLGNGRLGVMVWGDGAPLRLTLDHADLWDLRANQAFRDDPRYNYAGLRRLVREGRFDEAVEVFEERERRDNPLAPTKVSLGRAELALQAPTSDPLTLDLDRGVTEGPGLTVFVHREHDAICLRAPSPPSVTFLPLAQMTPDFSALGHPEPRRYRAEDVELVVQQLVQGPATAVAWCAHESDVFVGVALAEDGDQAAEQAAATARAARAEGFEALLAEHVAGWEAFWSGSAVRLPEPDLERLWYLGVYLLAACSRPGSLPPGLQGVWAMDGILPPWRGDYHADMNVQETFWPACCSGHLDLLDAWCDHMRDALPQARALARRFFGTEGAFWPCSFLPGLTPAPGWYTVQFAWSSVGWLAWLVWLRWRYSLDTWWLAETGYPLVGDILRFYRANVEERADGRLHVPLSTSPEYRENQPAAWASDPAVDLALIRRCCDWVVEMEQALGIDELTASAQSLRERLAPYPLTEGGVLCLWPGHPLDESHRHPSHLMAIHPAMDLTIEGDEEAQR
ncbi:MAG: hypothetical protein FJX74_22095, partial [Armatimonadetes bacterium]|nr:hypothetical protein [Armatimonadota bacterium]